MINHNIGGVFELPNTIFVKNNSSSFEEFFELPNYAAIVNYGRSAISLVLDSIDFNGKKILLPDYLCADIYLNICKEKRIDVLFYEVSLDLSIDINTLLEKIDQEIALVVFINYFGICDFSLWGKRLKNVFDNVDILIDNVQSFYKLHNYESYEDWADWQVYSMRKYFPVPDGAVLISKKLRKLEEYAPVISNSGIFYLAAAGLKRLYLNSLSVEGVDVRYIEKKYLELFKCSADFLKKESTGISEYSLNAMALFDHEIIKKTRRDNYLMLDELFIDNDYISPVVSNISSEDIPLVFPFMVSPNYRNRIRTLLSESRIFCPVHWPMPKEMKVNAGAGACELSYSILSIPIDQRYTVDDMKYIYGVLVNIIGKL